MLEDSPMTRDGDDLDARAAALLNRWQRDGDRDALDDLLRIEIDLLKARIRTRGARSTGADHSVSDVAQEAVMRTLNVALPPQFDNPRAMRGYLWTAASRLLADRLRRSQLDCVPLDDSASQALDDGMATTGGLGDVDRRDQSVALDTLMQLLEPGERRILELVFTRGLDYEAAAAELAITPDAAKMRCARAKQRLARKLRDWSELIG
jgi:RNA polymerase sigma factor (sigma-70 family)